LDTKSKSSNKIYRGLNRTGARVLLFIFCALFFAGGISLAFTILLQSQNTLREKSMSRYNDTTELFSDTPYLETSMFSLMAQYDLIQLQEILAVIKNPAYIESGQSSEAKFVAQEKQIYIEVVGNAMSIAQSGNTGENTDGMETFEWSTEDGGALIPFECEKITHDTRIIRNADQLYGNEGVESEDDGENVEQGDDGTDAEELFPAGDSTLADGNPFNNATARAAFEEIYAKELQQVREEIKEIQMRQYENTIEELKSTGIQYFISDGQTVSTNVKLASGGTPSSTQMFLQDTAAVKAFEDAPASLAVSGGAIIRAVPEGLVDYLDSEMAPLYNNASKGMVFYAAYPKEVIATNEKALNGAREQMTRWLILAGLLLIASLVLFILLFVFTGRKRIDGTRRLYALDKIFVEIQLVCLAIIVFLPAAYGFRIWNLRDAILAESPSPLMNLMELVVLIGVLTLLAAVALWFFFSLVRNLKARLFLRRSLIRLILVWIFRGIRALARTLKSGFDGRNPLAKTIVLVALLWGLTAIIVVIAGAAGALGGAELRIFQLCSRDVLPVIASRSRVVHRCQMGASLR